MKETYLKSLFEGAVKYHLKVQPASHLRVTQGDKWIRASTDEYLKSYDDRKGGRTLSRKRQLVKAIESTKELQWVAKRDNFSMGSNFIMVFMKHCPASWKKGIRKPGKRDFMVWQPMKNRPDVDNYCKKIFDSLLPEDREVWCAAIMKIWIPDEVEEGTYFIYVPDFFQAVVDYLKSVLSK
jgi:hypothetical protein